MAIFLNKAIAGVAKELEKEYSISPESAHLDDSVAFMAEQLQQVPWFLRFGIIVVTYAFLLNRIVAGFLRKSSGKFYPLTRKWRGSRLKVCRDLVRFYSTLFLLEQFSKQLQTQAKVLS